MTQAASASLGTDPVLFRSLFQPTLLQFPGALHLTGTQTLPCSTNNQATTISAMEIHVIPFRRLYLLHSVYFEFKGLCLATGCQCPSVACFLFSSMLHICVTRRGHIQRGTNLLVFHLQSTHREGLADPKPGSIFPKGTWSSSAAPSTAPGMPEARTGSALCREPLLVRSRKPSNRCCSWGGFSLMFQL